MSETHKSLAYLRDDSRFFPDLRHAFYSVDYAKRQGEAVGLDGIWTYGRRITISGMGAKTIRSKPINETTSLELADIEIARRQLALKQISEAEQEVFSALLEDLPAEPVRVEIAKSFITPALGGIAVFSGSFPGVNIAAEYFIAKQMV